MSRLHLFSESVHPIRKGSDCWIDVAMFELQLKLTSAIPLRANPNVDRGLQ